MVDVLDARLHANGSNATWFGVGSLFGGRKIIVLLGDRGGGATAECNLSGMPLTLRESEMSTSSNGTTRRSVFVFDGVVEAEPNNQILASTILDSASNPVDHCRIAIIIDADGTWEVVASAANPGASPGTAVSSRTTGTAAPVPAGDIILIAGDMTRGDTTKTWGIATRTPPNPGGGNWNLQQSGGTAGNNARNISLAFLFLENFGGAPGYQDSVSYGTNRMASALALVLTPGSAPPPTPEVQAEIPLSLALGASTTAEHTVTSEIPLSLALGAESAVQHEVSASIPLDLAMEAEAATGHSVSATIPLDIMMGAEAATGHSVQAEISLSIEIQPETSEPTVVPEVQAEIPLSVLLGATAETTHSVDAEILISVALAPATETAHSVQTVIPLSMLLAPVSSQPSPPVDLLEVTVSVGPMRSGAPNVGSARSQVTPGILRDRTNVGVDRAGVSVGPMREKT